MASASRMIASSVCTARAGYAPTAVSPASMIASTPSSTALAASLTSARVGRGFDRSSTRAPAWRRSPGCRARRARAGDVLLRARHALERHLEPEIAAGHHHGVARREDLVEMVERLRPLELGDERHVRRRRPRPSAGAPAAGRRRVCTKLSATMSTPSDEAELQIVDVLQRDRRRRQRDARRVDALVLAELAAFDDRRLDLACRRSHSTRSSISAVGEQQAIAGPHAARQAGERRRDAPGPPGKSPVAIAQRRRPASAESAVRLRAAGADLRAAEILKDRDLAPGALRPPRGRARTSRACDSCVPCEKLSRKMSVPAAISASSIGVGVADAGPTVAMIFVWRIVAIVDIHYGPDRSGRRSSDTSPASTASRDADRC